MIIPLSLQCQSESAQAEIDYTSELPFFLYGKQSKTTPVSTGVFFWAIPIEWCLNLNHQQSILKNNLLTRHNYICGFPGGGPSLLGGRMVFSSSWYFLN
jgi:hypothetical protein